jgi:pimeloyl-ACP methyl ester carboxylesterase
MKRWMIPCLLACVLTVFWLEPAEGEVPVVIPRKRIGVVVCANGAGGDTSMSANLGEIIAARGIPLAVHTIYWSRFEAPVKDHLDEDGMEAGGRRMANYARNYRAAFPAERIFLLGHSDGTSIVLRAADRLPPAAVDRIVLLAASVSWKYDLRQALRSSCGGVDAMISPLDRLLYTAATEVGTADRKWISAAGEVGFGLLPPNHPDCYLYQNLRQYRWNPLYPWIGHRGGHVDYTYLAFLEAHVLPFFLAP